MTLLRRLVNQVTRDRRLWQALFWINLLGSFYGFWWYRDQLMATPVKYWLIVPDSPGSTLLFSFFLLTLLTGRFAAAQSKPIRLTGWVSLLAAVAFVSNMKYGLWTAIVLPEYAIRSGILTFDTVHLSLSHFGMWVQGILFAHYYRPGLPAALAALGWMLFQDYVDYWLLLTYPTLPADWMEPSARSVAVTLSLVWGAYLAWRSSQSTEPHSSPLA